MLVEPMGFEPTTSSMPSRRAPNCATAPPPSDFHFTTFALSLIPSCFIRCLPLLLSSGHRNLRRLWNRWLCQRRNHQLHACYSCVNLVNFLPQRGQGFQSNLLSHIPVSS